MPPNSVWKIRPVGEMAKVMSGYAFKSSEFQSEGIPVIKIKNIRDGFVDLTDAQCVDEKYLTSIDTKFQITRGDLLISLTGSHITQPDSVVGRVARYLHRQKSLLNQRGGKITITNPDGCDALFLFYMLISEENSRTIALMAQGAASQANISPSQVESLRILIPDVVVQRKIAAILSAYDDLIENNNRRIKILEEIAQLVYQEWFIKFHFPGYEDVNMIDSLVGKIPEGWEIGSLNDLVESIRDGTKPGEHLSTRRYLPIECLPRKRLVLSESKSWQEAQSSLQLFEPKDIIFGAMRTYFHKVVTSPFKGVTRTTCFVLRPRSKILEAYSLLTMFRDDTIGFASAHSQGATIPYAVWNGSLSSMPVIVPPNKLLKSFQDAVSPILEFIRKMSFKQENLRLTRDLLLPKLISGEIDVSDLDINIGEESA